jgi:hypothetical protein
MTRQGPERAIGRLHPQFVNRLAAAIAEARGSGLPLAGIFSAYRPPAFGVGGFVDKFHSLHTYDGDRRTRYARRPALARDRSATRRDLPVRAAQPGGMESLSADAGEDYRGRESTAPDRYSGRSNQSRRHVRTRLFSHCRFGRHRWNGADPPVHVFKPPQARTEIREPRITAAATIKSAHNQRLPIDFDSGAIQKPPISGGKLGWPKGVPRIANLDEELRGQTSSAKSRTLPLKTIVMPRIIADSSGGRK